jgi:hypothetical protein
VVTLTTPVSDPNACRPLLGEMTKVQAPRRRNRDREIIHDEWSFGRGDEDDVIDSHVVEMDQSGAVLLTVQVLS